jgi:DNA-binding MltR family transcriptional regulator
MVSPLRQSESVAGKSKHQGKRARQEFSFGSFQSTIDKLQGQSESDRACAILATSGLDVFLEKLIKLSFVSKFPEKLFDYPGPLSSFASKIDLAYAQGLISVEERMDLHTLRDVRNKFAHDVDSELSFDTGHIADQIGSLNLSQDIRRQPHLKNFNTNRSIFLVCIALLVLVLSNLRAKNAKRPAVPERMTWARPSPVVRPQVR